MTDFAKPVQTRSGVPVELVTTEGRYPYPLVGYIDADHIVSYWSCDGLFQGRKDNHDYDLINVPEKRVVYIYFYKSSNQSIFALGHECSAELIAKRRVEYTEGQFDD